MTKVPIDRNRGFSINIQHQIRTNLSTQSINQVTQLVVAKQIMFFRILEEIQEDSNAMLFKQFETMVEADASGKIGHDM